MKKLPGPKPKAQNTMHQRARPLENLENSLVELCKPPKRATLWVLASLVGGSGDLVFRARDKVITRIVSYNPY